ncbi:dihydrodipicolinate synthase family protein [Enterococcus sp. UD-01]|jgi:4-hydroxy-tetrahydrodipicolinate synthase|uniref:dihydrodipicolinate synthase family protein n=1 Tax=Enterococcus sp. UD-01 TaxID=3373911 RepID=UPI0038356C1F
MLEGIITPIVTPFNHDDAQTINYEAAGQLIDYLIEHGVKGIFPLGSNGEFHVLSYQEKVDFMRYVVKKVNKRVPVYVGTGACSLNEALALSKEAEQAGADALSVITPYFIQPSEAELIAYFTTIAQHVAIPIILYNIPKNTGCLITPAVIKALRPIENIIGIKDSSGDEELLKAYIECTKDSQIKVLVGSDSKISVGYELGAVGAIAGTSNLIVDIVVSLDQALRAGNTELAQKKQAEIEPLRAALKLGTVPSILKRALELADIASVGSARRPVLPTSEKTDTRIIEMLKFYF